MSKRSGWILASIIIAILSISFLASAQQGVGKQLTPLKDLFDGVWDVTTGILSTIMAPIIGGSNITSIGGNPVGPGELLFVKSLLFFIILVMTWSACRLIPLIKSSKMTCGLISFAVSALSVRYFLTENWIETVLLPYNVYGVLIATLLPLALYFFLLEKGFEGRENRILRKTGWIVGAVVFAGMLMSRWLAGTVPLTGLIIYGVAAIACLVFFALDGTIQAAWASNRDEQLTAIALADSKAEVRKRVNEIRAQVYPPAGTAPIYIVGRDGKINDPDYRVRYLALLGVATAHGMKNLVESMLPEPN